MLTTLSFKVNEWAPLVQAEHLLSSLLRHSLQRKQSYIKHFFFFCTWKVFAAFPMNLSLNIFEASDPYLNQSRIKTGATKYWDWCVEGLEVSHTSRMDIGQLSGTKAKILLYCSHKATAWSAIWMKSHSGKNETRYWAVKFVLLKFNVGQICMTLSG